MKHGQILQVVQGVMRPKGSVQPTKVFHYVPITVACVERVRGAVERVLKTEEKVSILYSFLESSGIHMVHKLNEVYGQL